MRTWFRVWLKERDYSKVTPGETGVLVASNLDRTGALKIPKRAQDCWVLLLASEVTV